MEAEHIGIGETTPAYVYARVLRAVATVCTYDETRGALVCAIDPEHADVLPRTRTELFRAGVPVRQVDGAMDHAYDTLQAWYGKIYSATPEDFNE